MSAQTPAANGSPGAPLQLPPFDPGNPLIQQHPALPALWTSVVAQTPEGPILLFTIRTPDVTLTLKLVKADAEQLARSVIDATKNMSGLILPPSGGVL